MEAWRRSAAVAVLLAATVAGVSGAVTTSAAAGVRPASAAAGWTPLSSGDLLNIENIGVARFGSDLQVAWVQHNADSTDTLDTRIIGSDGSPKSAIVAVASNWASLNEFPAVLANGAQRVIAFSGLQNSQVLHVRHRPAMTPPAAPRGQRGTRTPEIRRPTGSTPSRSSRVSGT